MGFADRGVNGIGMQIERVFQKSRLCAE